MTDAPQRALLVVTAVKAESRAVLAALQRPTRASIQGFPAWQGRAGDRTVPLVQCGTGPARAAAALAATSFEPDLVVVLGVAGALVPTVVLGDVVLPESIVWRDGKGSHRHAVPLPPWHAARKALVSDSALRVHTGPLLSSSVVVASTDDKRRAAEQSGAVAVEMETAGLVAGAVARGTSVLAVRVVLDGADVSLAELPADLDASWAARARLVGRPRAWPIVARLARDLPRATDALIRVSRLVLPAI